MLLLSTEGRAEVKRSIKTSFEREAFLITFESRKETFFFLASATEFIVFWGRAPIFFEREGRKNRGGSREDEEGSPWKGISHRITHTRARARPLSLLRLAHTTESSRPPLFRTYESVARACVCMCVRACTFLARVRVSQPRQPVETRATIFEPRKERSRMNFLHNFGSPRRF